ncbi:MAG: hypothetical protein MdMp014T_2520 [Treponematales bacterium]
MCWYCGAPITEEEPVGRSLRCAGCGKDLRSCRNCKLCLADGGCAEGQADSPQDKERANFCDWFAVNPKFRKLTAGQGEAQARAEAAKAALDGLFGNSR